ncbi:MAG: alpha-galactosidase [Massilia sp.]|nr:alpha-galactosidase [Massilia sp.]MDB5952525.1 alpha-galactosidase [Massilia sp.]
MRFDHEEGTFKGRGMMLGAIAPLVNSVPAESAAYFASERELGWTLAAPYEGATLILRVEPAVQGLGLTVSLSGLAVNQEIDSIGVRFAAVDGVERYLRNGYQSWDGSYLARPGEPPADDNPGRSPSIGYAFTALLPGTGDGCLLLGFTRCDRFQNRFGFAGDASKMRLDVETLWDRTAHDGSIFSEPMVLFEGEALEPAMRAWSHILAAQSPLTPRIPDRRITGWCSWYNLYAAIDEAAILDHLEGAVRFRDRNEVALDVFLIDDGFTPEMGDWLDVKPQFPRAMAPLLADIASAGFTPGLWIAPFMVGNRSRLFRDHPDWVVRERATGAPLAHMKFYGEFRWHKRSEEYYILDITHPDAEAYIRTVFRTWRREWGCGYFKTDFMLFGADHGPDKAAWHTAGLSRIAIWRKMAQLIRDEIDDALWLGCGCPLWASVGLVDAIRIGRDVGVTWKGDYSAESLLRDQVTRNHGAGVLWQADPDCILLRSRFHDLSDDQVRSLALFAALAGGVLMSSDKLDELTPEREAFFAGLLREAALGCEFPQIEALSTTGVVVQRGRNADGTSITNLFNTRGEAAVFDRHQLAPYASKLVP